MSVCIKDTDFVTNERKSMTECEAYGIRPKRLKGVLPKK